MRILLVEDEINISKLVQMNLELEGYEVVTADNGKLALDELANAHYDLMILDLMLPKVSGIEVLTSLRLTNTSIPVIITSAKDTSTDRINGLREGADDYLVKPFEIEELMLRINKLIDRSATTITPTKELDIYTFGPNEINFKTFQAKHHNKTFDLKPKEIQIMKFLISKKNIVVSRQEILRHVWGYDVYPSTRTIDNFIANLRKYFEPEVKNPVYLKSIRGVGYKFIE